MKVVRYHKSPFERQIHESVLIQASKPHFLLNSKMEYNRCQIPRIAIKMGEREIKERQKDLENEIIDEQENERILETRIKALKKLINKKRAPRRPQKCEPGRKKMRLDPNGDISNEILGLKALRENEAAKKIEENRLEQLKRRDINLQPPDKRHCRADIRKYFTESSNLQNKKPPKENKSESKSTDLQPPKPPHPLIIISDEETTLTDIPTNSPIIRIPHPLIIISDEETTLTDIPKL